MIEEQKEEPAFFIREYGGSYGYSLGNVFLHEEIENYCFLSKYPNQINFSCLILMGIDPGFGSSKFAKTVLQLEDNIVKIIRTSNSFSIK